MIISSTVLRHPSGRLSIDCRHELYVHLGPPEGVSSGQEG
jgi:hypothetical protein